MKNFQKMHNNIKVTITFIAEEFHPTWQEASLRNVYRVTCTNQETKAKCGFKFYDSINNTENGIIYPENLYYSVMACIKSDFYYTEEYYPTYTSFCNDFDYDAENSENLKIYKACLRQGEKLHKVFDNFDIEQIEG